MCILSGCDYLPSVPGLGIRKSYTLIKTCRTAAQAICVIKNKGMNVPSNYDKLFEQAELTFLHQRVWDPEKLQLVHLTPLPEALQLVQQDNLSFLGPFLSRDVAQQIATGIIHPDTKLHYVRPAPASSLRRSAPVMATTTPPARNTKIGQFFAPMRPQTSPRVSTGRVNLGVSPYFNTSNKVAPIKSRFLINRSASSPSLHLPKTIQKQFVRPPVRKQEKEEASEVLPIPFSLGEQNSLDVVEEKENRILVVTSRYFPLQTPTKPQANGQRSLFVNRKPKKSPSHASKFQVNGITQTPKR